METGKEARVEFKKVVKKEVKKVDKEGSCEESSETAIQREDT